MFANFRKRAVKEYAVTWMLQEKIKTKIIENLN